MVLRFMDAVEFSGRYQNSPADENINSAVWPASRGLQSNDKDKQLKDHSQLAAI